MQVSYRSIYRMRAHHGGGDCIRLKKLRKEAESRHEMEVAGEDEDVQQQPDVFFGGFAPRPHSLKLILLYHNNPEPGGQRHKTG